MSHNKSQTAELFSQNTYLGLGLQGFHRLNYLQWGEENHETLICVPGITRNARDFDYLAAKMSSQYRIICPDIAGRGDSDHLENDEAYNYLQYNADMNALIARLRVDQVNWLGTSMGGIIGMVLASVPNTPIKRLIINDIGPEVSRDALMSIAEYIGKSEEFASLTEAETYLREIYSEFAPMSDSDWQEMAKHSSKSTDSGAYRLKFDPKIGDAFRDSITYFDIDMWDTWEQISCPVLVLRGKDSRFLTQETAARMQDNRPDVTLVEFENTGHTPTLRNAEQVSVIEEWLTEN